MSLNRPSPLINVQPKLGNRNNHVSVEIYPSEPDPPHISVDIFPFELPQASRKGEQPVHEQKKGDQQEQREKQQTPESRKEGGKREQRDPDETIANEARRATADCLLQLLQFFTRKINMLVKSQVERLLKHLM